MRGLKSQNTIRHWESELGEAFVVPRDAQQNRFYKQLHIDLILDIKKFREEENMSLASIKRNLLFMEQRTKRMAGQEGGLTSSKSVVEISKYPKSQERQLELLSEAIAERIGAQMSVLLMRQQELFNEQSELIKELIKENQVLFEKVIESNERSEQWISEIRAKTTEKKGILSKIFGK